MVQFSAYKPYCQIVLWLSVLFVIVNIGLSALSATPVLSWLPETVTGTGYLEDTRRRVVQAEDEYRRGQVAAGDHLGVFVGISNMREAIQLGAIGPRLGPDWRLLAVAGAGFGIRDFVEYTGLLFDSELRPDFAVFGLSLHQLVDIRPRPAAERSENNFVNLLRRGDLRNAAVVARNSSWVYSRRQDVSVTVDTAALALRARLFRWFDVPLSPGESEKLSPWREPIWSDGTDHYSQATLDAQEKFFGARGIFEEGTYENSPNAFALLLDAVERFRRQHTRVVIVLMPESKKFYTQIPAEALVVLHRHLESKFPGDPPPVLDYRQAVDANGLLDHVHVNRHGRLEFSRRLAEDIRSLLPTGTKN